LILDIIGIGKLHLKKHDTNSIERKFCEFAGKIQTVLTDGSSDKLCKTAPLGKFLMTNSITSSQIINQIRGEDCEKINPRYGNTLGYTAAEVAVTVAGIDNFLFSIEEFVLPPPNPKDDNNYWDWYPFKSTIEAFVDCDKAKYNLVIRIEKKKITIKKFDESSELKGCDRELILNIKDCFKFVEMLSLSREVGI
tara:strand:+ start:1005 stop:1586 length:582 start_codon:yes stop_codon:yes gene_type:complete